MPILRRLVSLLTAAATILCAATSTTAQPGATCAEAIALPLGQQAQITVPQGVPTYWMSFQAQQGHLYRLPCAPIAVDERTHTLLFTAHPSDCSAPGHEVFRYLTYPPEANEGLFRARANGPVYLRVDSSTSVACDPAQSFSILIEDQGFIHDDFPNAGDLDLPAVGGVFNGRLDYPGDTDAARVLLASSTWYQFEYLPTFTSGFPPHYPLQRYDIPYLTLTGATTPDAAAITLGIDALFAPDFTPGLPLVTNVFVGEGEAGFFTLFMRTNMQAPLGEFHVRAIPGQHFDPLPASSCDAPLSFPLLEEWSDLFPVDTAADVWIALPLQADHRYTVDLRHITATGGFSTAIFGPDCGPRVSSGYSTFLAAESGTHLLRLSARDAPVSFLAQVRMRDHGVEPEDDYPSRFPLAPTVDARYGGEFTGVFDHQNDADSMNIQVLQGQRYRVTLRLDQQAQARVHVRSPWSDRYHNQALIDLSGSSGGELEGSGEVYVMLAQEALLRLTISAWIWDAGPRWTVIVEPIPTDSVVSAGTCQQPQLVPVGMAVQTEAVFEGVPFTPIHVVFDAVAGRLYEVLVSEASLWGNDAIGGEPFHSGWVFADLSTPLCGTVLVRDNRNIRYVAQADGPMVVTVRANLEEVRSLTARVRIQDLGEVTDSVGGSLSDGAPLEIDGPEVISSIDYEGDSDLFVARLTPGTTYRLEIQSLTPGFAVATSLNRITTGECDQGLLQGPFLQSAATADAPWPSAALYTCRAIQPSLYAIDVARAYIPPDDYPIGSYRLRLVTACPADFNADALINPDDLSDFITCFLLDLQSPGFCGDADFNHDFQIDPDDLADFLTAFFSPCP